LISITKQEKGCLPGTTAFFIEAIREVTLLALTHREVSGSPSLSAIPVLVVPECRGVSNIEPTFGDL